MIAPVEAEPDVPEILMGTEAAVDLPIIPMYLKNSLGKGRGVYAGVNIPYGTLIHISPILLFCADKDGSPHAALPSEACPSRRILNHYTYTFNSECQALALGLGSMFNHAKNNNVGFIMDKENLLIRYTTLTDIAKDIELCINYGNHLWFKDESSSADDSSEEGEDPFGRMEL